MTELIRTLLKYTVMNDYSSSLGHGLSKEVKSSFARPRMKGTCIPKRATT